MSDENDHVRTLRATIGRRAVDTAVLGALPPHWPDAMPEVERRLRAHEDRLHALEDAIPELTAGMRRLVEIAERVDADRRSDGKVVARNSVDVAVVSTRLGMVIAIIVPIALLGLYWLMQAKFAGLERQFVSAAAGMTNDGRIIAIIVAAPQVTDRNQDGRPSVDGLKAVLGDRVPGLTAGERDDACRIAPAACGGGGGG